MAYPIATYSTDADFNALARTIEMAIDIYFDGTGATPLRITRDTYLIDLDLLEEATSGDTIFDNPSSNEVTITLYSPDGIFNPTNASSLYYTKMRRGIKLKFYIRANSAHDWYPFGEGTVSDWYSAITGQEATVVANDVLFTIFGNDPVDLAPQRNELVSTFLTRFFTQFNITPVIDASITAQLPIAYVTDTNKQFLSDISTAMVALCNVDHSGDVNIRRVSQNQALRATFTDEDQIITMQAKSSINADYDAAKLVYHKPLITDDTEVFTLDTVTLAPGDNTLIYNLSVIPLFRFKTLSVKSTVYNCPISVITCTSKTISLTVTNPTAENITVKIHVLGQAVDSTAAEIGSEGNNILKVDNPYIQTPEYATSYYQVMSNFIQNAVPVLTMETRGNPLIQIGDKIRAQSTRYHLDFTGIVMRQHFQYNGGLTCSMTLLNAAILGGV